MRKFKWHTQGFGRGLLRATGLPLYSPVLAVNVEYLILCQSELEAHARNSGGEHVCRSLIGTF